MKKTGEKKNTKTTKVKESSKKRSYISDMVRRDMDSCIERDKKLAKEGIQKPKKDIFRDDPCYRCKFAIENKYVDGPFDRRFKCNGFPRIINELESAIAIVKKSGIGNQKFLNSTYPYPNTLDGQMGEDDVVKSLLKAQQSILLAASLISERIANSFLECVNTTGKPSCFVGANLDEYLKAK